MIDQEIPPFDLDFGPEPKSDSTVPELSEYDHPVHKVEYWATGSAAMEKMARNKLTEVQDPKEADIISSTVPGPGNWHTVMIDLDIPAHLVPSSTEGHSHLYIDFPMKWEQYTKLLDALAEAGIVEPGYVGASKERGFTSLRLPWVKKEEVDE